MRITQETEDFANEIQIGDSIKINPEHMHYYRVVDMDYHRDDAGNRVVTFYAGKADGSKYPRLTVSINDLITRVVRDGECGEPKAKTVYAPCPGWGGEPVRKVF